MLPSVVCAQLLDEGDLSLHDDGAGRELAPGRNDRPRNKLYPIESILESRAFNQSVGTESVRIAYLQAGVFVSYLIETYGLARMKRILETLNYSASLDTVRDTFSDVYGIRVVEAEIAWLEWLDQPRR